jgi:hypothetical protein
MEVLKEVDKHWAGAYEEMWFGNVVSEGGRMKAYEVVGTFEAELDGEEVPAAELRCPQSDCGRTFIVDREEFKTSKEDFVARSCPYCFRANRIPSRAS